VVKDHRAVSLLMSELRNDTAYIAESFALRGKAVTRCEAAVWNDYLDLLAVGAVLYSIYNAFEAYFLRVAKFFENNVDQLSWHRDLLDRMTLDIPGVRPALISDKGLAERIDELRRFRHVFRNLYKTRLTGPKLRIVNEAAKGCYEDFLPLHETFIRWLGELAQEL